MTQRQRYVASYLGLMVVGNFLWEFAQMPLYVVWQTGSVREIIYNGLHCTLGDVVITAAALAAAITFAGGQSWPSGGRLRVATAAIVASLAYTAFSEWLNVYVRQSWAYSELMPIVPGTGIGLSPMLQWILVPTTAFYVAGRRPHFAKR